jgi:RNA polymerase sigma-70 factor (ECF subfamily)
MRRLATVFGAEIDLPTAAGRHVDTNAEARDRTIALFRDLREPLGHYLVNQGVNPTEVEEVVQEAFLRLFRHLSRTHGPVDQNLNGWVFRVAQNLAHDRRRGWHGRNVDSLEDRPEAAQAAAAGVSPEDRVLYLEKMQRIRTAWVALPERQRRCMQLRSEGLRYRDIADVLGVSTTTVADMVRDAIDRLGAQSGRARENE